MALFSSYGQTESQYVRVGDNGFIGMDYRTAPDKLKEGVYSYGENVRARSKEIETRPGNPYIGWFYPDNYPYDEEYANGGVTLTGTWTVTINPTFSGASGSFTDGETLTGSDSGATGTYTAASGSVPNYVTLTGVAFQIGETVTGGTSSNTATVASYAWAGDDTDIPADGEVTVDSGTTSGTPYDDGYTYLRFSSGLILKATAEESGGTITVETQFISNGQSVSGDTFVWCKKLTSDEDGTKDLTRSVITDAGQTPITTGSFTDPDGSEYAVIITEDSAWFGSEYNRPFEVSIPGGIDDTAYLVQAFDRLFLFRGTGQEPLYYTTASGVWASISLVSGKTDATETTNYTVALPNANRALYFQNRLWVHVDDLLYVSDIGTPERYYYLKNEFRINTGEVGGIVALFPFGKYAILAFKESEIYLIDNVYGDVADNMRIRQISNKVGCGAPNTITNVGNDVWWCDVNGDVWSIAQVDEERLELSGEPVSWPIRAYWDTIGSKNVSNWAAAYHDSYFYLFLECEPISFLSSFLEGYTNLNRVAVYDTINQAWVSLDYSVTFDMIGVPMYLDWLEDKRLMMVDKDSGNLRVIGYGETDGTGTWDIISEVQGRGLYAEKGREQHCNAARVQIGSHDGDFNVYCYTDGESPPQGEYGTTSQLIIQHNTNSSNRLTYLNANEINGYDDWDPLTNPGDFANPYRYDYTCYLSDNTGNADPDDDGLDLPSTGIPLMKHQIWKLEQKCNFVGNYFQLRVKSTDGRIRIKDMSIAIRADNTLYGERV